MKTLAIQDAQIDRAIERGALKLRTYTSRPILDSKGAEMAPATDYIAVEDDFGLIELLDLSIERDAHRYEVILDNMLTAAVVAASSR